MVTLSLMVLLTIIAVGLLTLSSIALRASQQSTDMQTARANARLALMLAIGDLQKHVGPDQRVTANAEIGFPKPLRNKNMKWLGVWSTTALDKNNKPENTKPMVGGNTDLPVPSGASAPNAAYFTDRRNLDPTLANGLWKTKQRLAWLVSGDPKASANPTVGTTVQPHATMVEKSAGLASATAADSNRDWVSAPMVKISVSNNLQGGYAYWVGDESQKARIDLGTPYEQGTTPKQPSVTNPTDGGYYNLLGAVGPDFTNVKAGTSEPYGAVAGMSRSDRERILTQGSVALAVPPATDVKKNFHEITTDSLGVICDVREGGLKKDLTPFLERTGDIQSDSSVLPARSVGSDPVNPGLPANQPILIGPSFKQLGPNFAHLRNWTGLRQKVTGTLGAGKIDPQYPTAVQMTGTPMVPAGRIIDIAKQAQSIHPIMVDYSLSVDFSRDTARAAGRAIRTHLYPRVTMWNPYNVTLKGARYLVACRGFPPWPGGLYFGGKGASWIPGDPTYWFEAGYDWNAWFYFVTEPIDMAPGECLVFVPDVTLSPGEKLASNAAKYDVNNLANNILSATQKPGKGATNFFYPSHTKIDDSVDLATNINITCGTAYSNPYGMQVYFLKKAEGTGSIARTDVFTNPVYQDLQLINDSVNGGDDKSYWAWPVGSRLFETYESNDDRFPPAGFAQEMRTFSFADGAAQSSLAPYNLRASIAHRSPFCCGGAYYDQRMGHYRDCYFGSINLQDTNVVPSYLKGSDGVLKLRGSPFARAGIYGSVTSYPMFEVPQAGAPMFSLANLQSVQFGYQSWQPSFVIGHSLADIRSNRDASVNVAYFNNPARWSSMGGKWYEMLQMDLDTTRQQELLQYDMAFMVNQNLWDRYFLSALPYSGAPAGATVNVDPITTPLPNSHLIPNPFRSGADATLQQKIGTSATTTPFDYAAYYLMNQGAFNINSVSVEAWRACFSTLNTLQRPCATGDGTPVLAVFARMLVPGSNKIPVQAINDNGTWNGIKPLSPAEIDAMARNMADLVKARGPFLGLTDFVNRRLGPATDSTGNPKAWSPDEPTVAGPLQAVIDKSSLTAGLLNYKITTPADNLSNPKVSSRNGGGIFPTDNNAFYQWLHYGASGFLNQADLLQALAPGMTVRGDTFLVRGYGEARDASGKVTARAWCEAIVQRTPDYLVPTAVTQPSDASGNNPLEPLTVRSTTGNSWSANTNASGGILPINQLFGRKLVVTKFRWLGAPEV